MKITKVEIYNYKSIGAKLEIDLDEKATILVGKSNVGKTNILEAIKFAFTHEPLSDKDVCEWITSQALSVCVFLKVEDKDIQFIKAIDPSFANLQLIIINKYIDGSMVISAEPQ